MKYKRLGRSGEKIPAIGIGTWKLGRNPGDDMKAIRMGVSLGMRFIDTAEMYGTEELVGKAIKGEQGIFIATKVSPHHFGHDDLIRACDESLKNLGIKTIDLYQLHWPNEQVPIAETMGAMEELVKAGKIRHIGVCNFSARELQAAREALKDNDIVSDQIEYSVFVRDPIEDVGPYCAKEGITVIAYSPLARGMMFESERHKALAKLNDIGAKYGRTAAQVALGWLLSKEGVVAIPKAASIAHMRENAQAVDLKLGTKDLAAIDAMDNSGIRSISSRMNQFTRKTTSLWSNLMQKRERLRVKHGI